MFLNIANLQIGLMKFRVVYSEPDKLGKHSLDDFPIDLNKFRIKLYKYRKVKRYRSK